MIETNKTTKLAMAAMLLMAAGTAAAQSSVNYGRITAVNTVAAPSSNANVGGTVLGGTIGLVSGRNQSSSNQALRAGAGAFAGNRIARATTGGQAFEYTILQGGRTITVVTDEAGLRVGDCVAVERGGFNNLRLVDDARCNPPRPAPAPARPAAPPAAAPAPAPAPAPASQSAVREANACVAAKDQLLAAETDEAFDRAERRVRLLCAD
jgi:outer membrane lipoprotein SlyB